VPPGTSDVRWQVQRDTLLDRTHQWWKLRFATVGVVISLVIQFVPRYEVNDTASSDVFIYSIVSIALALSSLILLFWGVSCPGCRAKWAQLAVRQASGRWLQWLCSLQRCPKCGSAGTPPNHRDGP